MIKVVRVRASTLTLPTENQGWIKVIMKTLALVFVAVLFTALLCQKAEAHRYGRGGWHGGYGGYRVYGVYPYWGSMGGYYAPYNYMPYPYAPYGFVPYVNPPYNVVPPYGYAPYGLAPAPPLNLQIY